MKYPLACSRRVDQRMSMRGWIWTLAGLAAGLVCVTALVAQPPDPAHFWWGKIVSIRNNAETGQHEYTIWNGTDDAFVGASSSPLKVRVNKKVRCAVVEPHAVYIVDNDGKIQELSYVLQAEVTRKRRLPRWLHIR